MLFKLSNLNSNLALNPALNNLALASKLFLYYLYIYQQKYTARAEFHVKTLPESPPIKGLFSKCSTNSLKHEKVPIPNLYCEPSQPIWKCFTELAHLKTGKMKIDPAVLTSQYQKQSHLKYCYPLFNSPLLKGDRNWSQNASCNIVSGIIIGDILVSYRPSE